MTTPSPSPRSKRMVGFYVGMGVAVALFVGGWFAWTPLRVWYWHRRVLQACEDEVLGGANVHPRVIHNPKVADAVWALCEVGPRARHSVARLLALPDALDRASVAWGSHGPWAVSLLAGRVAEGDKDRNVIMALLSRLGTECNKSFLGPSPTIELHLDGDKALEAHMTAMQDYVDAGRLRFLEWWEREGKAKYGRGGE